MLLTSAQEASPPLSVVYCLAPAQYQSQPQRTSSKGMSESSDAATSCGSRPGNSGGADNTAGGTWSTGQKLENGSATAIAQHSAETGSAFQKYVRKEAPLPLRADGASHNADRTEAHLLSLDRALETASGRSGDQQQNTKNSKQSTSTGVEDFGKLEAMDSEGPSADHAGDSDDDGEPGSSGKDTASGKGRKNKHSSTGDDEDENGKNKKQRLIWTPELHARFLNAVNHLGVKNAVPKTILQLMNVEGMTRENVASHLQKYRLYLKRLAGLPPNAPLSAETLQQVQNVQQAMQQQVQAGFQKNQAAALQLGQLSAGMPTMSLAAAMPAVSLTQNYQELVNQLMASAGASNAATSLQGMQANTLNALQRQALLGVGMLPGIVPMGVIPVTMGGFGGINPALLAGGTIGLVSGAGAGHHIMLNGANMGMHLGAQMAAVSQGMQLQ